MPTTPKLSDVIRGAIESALSQTHVSLVCYVLAYDPATQTADVQPIVRQKGNDPLSEPEKLPVIGKAPVLFPSGGGVSIVWPLLPGDEVTVLIASQSIRDWQALGTQDVFPVSNRRNSLSDAFVIPGPRPITKPRANAATAGADLVLGREDGSFEVRIGPAAVQLGDATAFQAVALAPLVESYLGQIDLQLKGLGLPGLTPLPVNVSATKVKAV